MTKSTINVVYPYIHAEHIMHVSNMKVDFLINDWNHLLCLCLLYKSQIQT